MSIGSSHAGMLLIEILLFFLWAFGLRKARRLMLVLMFVMMLVGSMLERTGFTF